MEESQHNDQPVGTLPPCMVASYAWIVIPVKTFHNLLQQAPAYLDGTAVTAVRGQ
jgi:hypothetical protein